MINASLLVSPVAFLIMAILYFNFSGKTVNRLLDVAMAFVGSLMAFAFARLICRFSAGSFLKSGFVWAGVASLELYAIHWCLFFNTSFIILPWPVLFSVWLCLSVVIILVYRLLRSKLIVMIRGDMCADREARKR